MTEAGLIRSRSLAGSPRLMLCTASTRSARSGARRALSGKSWPVGAAVFGAASGIGAAIARAFAAEGARIAVIDLDPRVIDFCRAVARIDRLWCADVCDYAAVRHAAEEITRRLGRCEHVVYAVGAGSGKFGFPFWNLEPSDWERVLKVNLIGAVNVAHAFAPAMAEANRNHERDRTDSLAVASISLVGRRPDGFADRPSLQCRQGSRDQFCPVCSQGPRALRRAGEHALSGHGADPAQPRSL